MVLESVSGPHGYVSRLGCWLWFICAAILGGLLVLAMKYCTEWSEGMFGPG